MKTSLTLARFHLLSIWNWRTSHLSRVIEAPAYFLFMVTGLSTLAIRIQDRSTEQLSNEMLRGRYVERGMGITADLLSRYDGSIAVEPEPGWQKAVVLRFFTVEELP